MNPFIMTLHLIWRSAMGKIVFALGLIAFVLIEASSGRNDLDIFLAASRDLFAHQNIYVNTYFDGYHYYYSVLFASVIRPMADWSSFYSKAFWISLNILLLFRIWKIVFIYLKASWLKLEMKTLIGFLLLIFCLRFIRGNLHLCQMTIFILYLSLEALFQIQQGKKWVGVVLLAFAINIKLLPLVLIPYLFYRNEWRAALYVMALIFIMFLVPSIWLGHQQNMWLIAEWKNLVNPLNKQHLLDVEETSFHSLTTLCATLFIEDLPEKYGLHSKRNIANLSFEQLAYIIAVLRIILIGGTLWFLRSRPFTTFIHSIHTWWEMSYLLLIVPLIFPHQQHYAFLFALPAIAYLIFWLCAPQRRDAAWKFVLCISIVIYILFNLSLLLGIYNAWYNHYKLLTYGALLLVILIAFLDRRVLSPATENTEPDSSQRPTKS